MSLLERRRALMSLNKGILPPQYRQVEYIEKPNTHTQWIDTGVLASENNSFEVKAQLLDVNVTSQTFWGGRNSSVGGSVQGNQLSYAKSAGGYQFNCGNIADLRHTAIPIDKKSHIYYANKNVLYIDNTYYMTITSATITAKNNVYLFATNTKGAVGFSGGTIRLYYAKIWNKDILVRHFIPCCRKADNEAGLFDLVSGEFYENQGTGEFLIGGEI